METGMRKEADCTWSHARAVRKGTDGGDNNELLVDEEKAEHAAASEAMQDKAEDLKEFVAVATETSKPDGLPKSGLLFRLLNRSRRQGPSPRSWTPFLHKAKTALSWR
ncbi:hypothetical protein IscW_ISCW000186 [Ixodes scapularis]|uniref:Uncharacterized protein n=1 Tax=Ixodes scapularis TaxID=6945 RepID=B7P5W0_IXOSC|nr:hypothetical protein IscW_ISCW000186 [Ixodes scapularis]|eukprot:XP_002408045.1 hypothetical protein IscW_ISCW000186 [Ixodes scapularis]